MQDSYLGEESLYPKGDDFIQLADTHYRPLPENLAALTMRHQARQGRHSEDRAGSKVDENTLLREKSSTEKERQGGAWGNVGKYRKN